MHTDSIQEFESGQKVLVKVLKTRLVRYFPLKPLSKSEESALLWLAEEGEGTMFDVSKKEKIYYSLTHGAFKKLLKRGLIRKDRDEKSSRNLIKTIYKPTTAGLLYAFIKQPENQDIFKRVKKHFSEPIEWIELFERHGAGRFMASWFLSKIAWYLRNHEEGYRVKINLEPEEIIGDLMLEKEDVISKIAKAVTENQNLRKTSIHVIKSDLNWLQKRRALLEKTLNFLEASNTNKNR